MESFERNRSCNFNWDNYADLLCPSVSQKEPSPVLPTREISRETFTTWSSASQITVPPSSDVTLPMFPSDHHQPVPRLPSFSTPSLQLHFTPPETASEVSLLTWSHNPYVSSSKESLSIYSNQEQLDLSFLPLSNQKLILDHVWTRDKMMATSEWISGLGSFHDDRTYTLSPKSDIGSDSILNRIRSWLQSFRSRLFKGHTTTAVEILKKTDSDWDSSDLSGDVRSSSLQGSNKQNKGKTIRKRVQKFLSRVFICGKPSED